MKAISLVEAQKYTSPNPIVLVCTQTPKGETNLCPVGWWTYVSRTPAMIGFSLNQLSYTGEVLRDKPEVALVVPGADIAEEAFKCGTCSGRDVKKTDSYGIQLMDMAESMIMVPEHSALVFHGKVKEVMPLGDHTFFLATIDNVYVNDKEKPCFGWDGYDRLAPLN